MPVRARKNQYRGINAHWHSLLQQEAGGWVTFHSDHITNIKEALNRVLPENYYARTEKSLQVALAQFDIDPNIISAKTTRPDVGIFQTVVSATPHVSLSGTATPTLTLPASWQISVDEELNAVTIYEIKETHHQPVTRIKLLSASNKPPHHRDYLSQRSMTLSAGICLVEMDYLHETPSPIYYEQRSLPDYPRQEANAYPYSIAVTDPHSIPAYPTGLTSFYCFHVDEPIPVIPIPLARQEAIPFDFNRVYQHTFENDRYAYISIDYSQPPLNMQRYSPFDQARIEKRRLAVVQAAEQGDSLEHPPISVED